MHEGTELIARVEGLPGLIERAAAALANATSAAEVLDAKDRASMAYSFAKQSAQIAKLKDAHDTVIAACRQAMADALVIEKQARYRLAEEYDVAQERGEVAGRGGTGSNQHANIPKQNISSSVTDIGLTSKEIHEARFWRDVEKGNPGIVRRTVDAMLAAGEEPTRAAVKRAILQEITPPPPVRQTDVAPAPQHPAPTAARPVPTEVETRSKVFWDINQALESLESDIAHIRPEEFVGVLDIYTGRFQEENEERLDFETDIVVRVEELRDWLERVAEILDAR